MVTGAGRGIGLELARWSYGARVTVYACELLLMTVICQNIILINIIVINIIVNNNANSFFI